MERTSFQITEEEKKDVVKRSYKFALRTLYIAGKLPRNTATFRLIDQLVGAGTSIGRTLKKHPQDLARAISLIRCPLPQKKRGRPITG